MHRIKIIVCKVPLEEPEGMILSGTGRHRWEACVELDVEECGLDSSDSGEGQMMRSREHDNEHFGSIKCAEFPDKLANY
jgi:hypothetical protein